MNVKDYLKTFEGLQAEQKWGRIFMGALIGVILVLVLLVFRKETVVTIQPWTLTKEAMLTQTNASESYKEAWGYALAQLVGNVTPATVDFVSERIGPLLSPTIYQDVIDVIQVQAQEIKNDRVSTRFEPRFIEYEKITDKVFVFGYAFVKGTAGEGKRSMRTYEYIIEISNYAPLITFMDVYSGKPRTEAVLKKIELKEQKQKEKERQNEEK